MSDDARPTCWVRFWHEPVPAGPLALTRIAFAGALLAEQLTQYLPNLGWMYGPDGFGPTDVVEPVALRRWRWSILFFSTDNLGIVTTAFWLWVAATVLLLLGWRTRVAAVLTWFGAYCFQNRNWYVLNGGDDLLLIGLFLLMISPCGRALSLDRLRGMRNSGSDAPPAFIPPWPVRLFQIQLCVIYLASGIAKLAGESWWDGTTIHYVLLDPTTARFSAALFPLPFWLTAALTWGTLAFELLFIPLVCFRRTRPWALWCGVLFHLGIVALVEVGWFSFYSLAMYGVWAPAAWASNRPR
jgi:hypothetical protein